MEKKLVFNLLNSTRLDFSLTGDLNSSISIKPSWFVSSLSFSSIFVNYGDAFTNLSSSYRFIGKYNWIERLVQAYFPGCFTLVNFSGTKAIIVYIKSRYLPFIINFLKYNTWFRFNMLVDLFANDYIARFNRFEITYCLVSPKRNERFYLRIFANELTIVPSLSTIYTSANWLEREVWDMYGISFAGHSDLRRILTDYGFLGHPLRKDFPLTGFFELRYDDASRRIVSESVNLSQELRLFFFSTSWRAL